MTESEYPKIVVGVIDTGIDLDHEFLKDRIIETNFNCSGSGKSNSEDDDQGHGTHVAGIIVDNTTKNVKIKGYKVFDAEGSGTTSTIILGIEKAIEDNVNVINMSLGGKGSTKALKDVVYQAYNKGITICVSAGNSATNASNYEPANIDRCITVGAHDKNRATPYWSNYGDCVDLIAPGVSIYSSYNDGDYKKLSGTSMASPFVSAASAMLLTNNIATTPQEVVYILQSYAKTNKYEDLYLYLGYIKSGNIERTATPKISVKGGNYSDLVTVELSCLEEADIYYSIDGSRATENSTLYTEPIVIDKVTNLHAVAIANGKIKSLQSTASYYITSTDSDINYVIDDNGTLVEYKGNNKYLTIPEKINGIDVLKIGNKVFYNKDIVMIKLPDSCETIGEHAFDSCESLTTVYANNIRYVKTWGFANCNNLTDIDLNQIESVEKRAFANASSILELNNDKLVEIPDYTFTHMNSLIAINLPNVERIGKGGLWAGINVETLNIPKVKYLDYQALLSYTSLKEIYLPCLTEIADRVFSSSSKLNFAFMPNLISAESLPMANDLYLSSDCIKLPNVAMNCRIIAPTGSYAEEWANENGHTFLDSKSCSFTEISGCEFVYTCSSNDEVCRMPRDILELIWQDTKPINKTPDFMAHGFLIDVVPDGVINAKDFAKIHQVNNHY